MAGRFPRDYAKALGSISNPFRTMPLQPICNRLAWAIFLCGTCLTTRSQVLERADAWFRENPTKTIRTEVDGKNITNDFPVYNRITGSEKGRIMPGLRLEETSVKTDIDRYGAKTIGSVSLNRVDFEIGVDVTLSDFEKGVQMHGVRFKGPFLGNWALYKEEAVFSRVRFDKESQFMRAKFDSTAQFKSSSFGMLAFFYGSYFRHGASFNDTRFDTTCHFSFGQFDRRTTFHRADFDTITRFNNAEFMDGAEFLNANFDSLLDFSNANVKGRIDFAGAYLPIHLDLSGMEEIEGTFDLLRVRPSKSKGECMVNLLNTDVSKVLLDYENFRLYFPAGTAFEEKVRVYEDLLEQFKLREMDDSYKKLDIEFTQFKYREKRESTANFLQQIWWNYGYDKNRIFIWIIRILLFFSIINTFFIKRLLSAITELPFLTRKTVEKHHLHHPIIAYFLNFPGTLLYTFIMIVSGSSGLSIIKDHTKVPNIVWMLYLIVLSLIGLSLSLFIFNYIIN
jgi:hypothetical protein